MRPLLPVQVQSASTTPFGLRAPLVSYNIYLL